MLVLPASCTSTKHTTSAKIPCDDSLYVSLQDRDTTTLTSKEYAYFIAKRKECDDYAKSWPAVKKEILGGATIALFLIIVSPFIFVGIFYGLGGR